MSIVLLFSMGKTVEGFRVHCSNVKVRKKQGESAVMKYL